jgi:hypothetical protein
MTPDQILALVQQWITVLAALFASLVTIASLLLKFVVAFVKSKQEMDANYKPGKFLVNVIALLQAFSQNSSSAAQIVAGKKG